MYNFTLYQHGIKIFDRKDVPQENIRRACQEIENHWDFYQGSILVISNNSNNIIDYHKIS